MYRAHRTFEEQCYSTAMPDAQHLLPLNLSNLQIGLGAMENSDSECSFPKRFQTTLCAYDAPEWPPKGYSVV